MSIATQLSQLVDSKNNIKEVLAEKGVAVENFYFNNLSTLMEDMSNGDSGDITIPMTAKMGFIEMNYDYNPSYDKENIIIYGTDKNYNSYKEYEINMRSLSYSSNDLQMKFNHSVDYKRFKILDDTIVFATSMKEKDNEGNSVDAVHVFISRDDGKTWKVIKRDVDNNILGPCDVNRNAYSNALAVILNTDSFALYADDKFYVSYNFENLKEIDKDNFEFEIDGNSYNIENIRTTKVSVGETNNWSFNFEIRYDTNKYCYTSDFKVFDKTFEKPVIITKNREFLSSEQIDDTEIINSFKEKTNNQSNEYTLLKKYGDLYLMSTYSRKEMYGPQRAYFYMSKDCNDWIQINTEAKYGEYVIDVKDKYYIITQGMGSVCSVYKYDKTDLTHKEIVHEYTTGYVHVSVLNLSSIIVWVYDSSYVDYAMKNSNSNIIEIKKDGTYTKKTMSTNENHVYAFICASERTVSKEDAVYALI